ncbi:hypothetical protein HID58_011122 [Brassica napus]|uniref:RING-CH-type domain-containing protein n=1 Tax=Brassica napus TaxID=3708 RepID=A0ABQ8DX98_BRANA|nr:hypothetical protein HID58_011122 [Brassica napus]
MSGFHGTHDSCPLVKNILLLDSEGKRVAVKYYSDDWPTHAAKLTFEKYVFSKTSKTNARTEAEITLLDSNIIVYKFAQDLHFFVTGGENENELVLSSVLQGFFDAVALLLRNNVEKMEALENLDLIFLCLDEMVDQGVVLETDPNVIAGKVAMQSTEASDINSSTGNSSGTSGKKSAYMSFLVSIACPHIIEWTSNFCEDFRFSSAFVPTSVMDGRDQPRVEEHTSLPPPPQREGDSPEIAQEEDPWRRGIVSGTTPEDTGEDLSRRHASLTSSPVAKRVNFSPMSSPRIGQRGASLSPSSSSSRNKPNSLKNLVPKLSFKNRNSDIEKADDLAFEGNGRDRSTWTLSNILTPRLKKTESLPVTPLAHSNPGSTHGRYVVDPVTSMKKGPPLPIHRSRSVPAFNKDGSLRQAGVFRVIPTPNMTPARNIMKLNDTDVDGGEDVPEEEAVCRICMVELGEDSDAFKMECMCRGELALAHKECTIKWFTIKGNRTCDVCKQEVQNLPVTLLRMQNSQGNFGDADTEASHYRQDVPVLVIVSMLAYFCFLEQLLLTKMKSGAIAISLPFSCVLGLLASMTTTTMVTKQYIWIYATVQFGLVVFFSHIFFSLVHMKPVVSILLATLVGFGLTMSGQTGLAEFAKWRRIQRADEPPSSSQVDPPPVQTAVVEEPMKQGKIESKGLNPGLIVLLVIGGLLVAFLVGNFVLYTYAQKNLPPRKKKPVSKKKMKKEKLKQGVQVPGE